jgi:hypothetical protein
MVGYDRGKEMSMDKNEFEFFLEKEANEPGIDKYEKIDEFECDLYELYNNIEAWLREYIDKKQITVEWDLDCFFLIEMEYKLPMLKLHVGKKNVLLNPQMIGFNEKQREVSMEGEGDTVYFYLPCHGGSWKVGDSFLRIQREGLEKDLDEETFLQFFMKSCTK